MDGDTVSRELALCLAPRLRSERDHYAVRLDTHFVDRRNVPSVRIENNYVSAIQVLDRDHNWFLLRMTPVIRRETMLTPTIRVKQNVTPIAQIRLEIRSYWPLADNTAAAISGGPS